MSNLASCIFGEVLFDQFPDGKRVLGGAPFNVAWHLQAFGLQPHFISRIGRDPQGQQILDAMRHWGMDTSGVQVDGRLATGLVDVRLVDGEPSYDIVCPVAYDAIQAPDREPACGLLYHGSLAVRESASYGALQAIKARHRGLLFVDVNLRPPWWQREQVSALLDDADWAKLNGDELRLLGGHDARDFIERHTLQGLILTHGSRGAEVVTADGQHAAVEPSADLTVIDTVGAGDAFASVMILGLTFDWPLQATLERAQGFASAIVGNRGATVNDQGFYQPFATDWALPG